MKRSFEHGLVSVIIPAYNAAWCIETALGSVLAQTYPEIETIVVNDGSCDNTAEILNAYDEKIKVVTQRNRGLSSARNLGIEHAEGEYLAFLDADDYWLPHKLSSQVSLMEKRPEVGFCSTAARVENIDGEFLSLWCCPKIITSALHTIFRHNAAIPGSGSGVMVRRKVLQGMQLFDENLKSLEDIDMWIRLSARTEYGCVAEALTVIKRHENSMSRNMEVMRRSSFKVMKKNRHLLDKRHRGGFWQACYAAVLADFAKWEYRSGRKRLALLHLLEGLFRSGTLRARMLIGLISAMLRGESL